MLKGVAFSGYRSFAAEPQRMEFPTPVTVLAGVNNSGKSNVLRYVQNVLPKLRVRGDARRVQQTQVVLSGLDLPVGYRERPPHRIALPVYFEPSDRREVVRLVRSGAAAELQALQNAFLTLTGEGGGSSPRSWWMKGPPRDPVAAL